MGSNLIVSYVFCHQMISRIGEIRREMNIDRLSSADLEKRFFSKERMNQISEEVKVIVEGQKLQDLHILHTRSFLLKALSSLDESTRYHIYRLVSEYKGQDPQNLEFGREEIGKDPYILFAKDSSSCSILDKVLEKVVLPEEPLKIALADFFMKLTRTEISEQELEEALANLPEEARDFLSSILEFFRRSDPTFRIRRFLYVGERDEGLIEKLIRDPSLLKKNPEDVARPLSVLPSLRLFDDISQFVDGYYDEVSWAISMETSPRSWHQPESRLAIEILKWQAKETPLEALQQLDSFMFMDRPEVLSEIVRLCVETDPKVINVENAQNHEIAKVLLRTIDVWGPLFQSDPGNFVEVIKVLAKHLNEDRYFLGQTHRAVSFLASNTKWMGFITSAQKFAEALIAISEGLDSIFSSAPSFNTYTSSLTKNLDKWLDHAVGRGPKFISEALIVLSKDPKAAWSLAICPEKWLVLLKGSPSLVLAVFNTLSENSQAAAAILLQSSDSWIKSLQEDPALIAGVLIALAKGSGFDPSFLVEKRIGWMTPFSKKPELLAKILIGLTPKDPTSFYTPKWISYFSKRLELLEEVLEAMVKNTEGVERLRFSLEDWGKYLQASPELLAKLLRVFSVKPGASDILNLNIEALLPHFKDKEGLLIDVLANSTEDPDLRAALLKRALLFQQLHIWIINNINVLPKYFPKRPDLSADIVKIVAKNPTLGEWFLKNRIKTVLGIFQEDPKVLADVLKTIIQTEEVVGYFTSQIERTSTCFKSNPELLVDLLTGITKTPESLANVLKSAAKTEAPGIDLAQNVRRWMGYFEGRPELLANVLQAISQAPSSYGYPKSAKILADSMNSWIVCFKDHPELLASVLIEIFKYSSEDILSSLGVWTVFLKEDPKWIADILVGAAKDLYPAKELAENVIRWMGYFEGRPELLANVLQAISQTHPLYGDKPAQFLVNSMNSWIVCFKDHSELLASVLIGISKYSSEDILSSADVWTVFLKEDPKWIADVLVGAATDATAAADLAQNVRRWMGYFEGKPELLANVLQAISQAPEASYGHPKPARILSDSMNSWIVCFKDHPELLASVLIGISKYSSEDILSSADVWTVFFKEDPKWIADILVNAAKTPSAAKYLAENVIRWMGYFEGKLELLANVLQEISKAPFIYLKPAQILAGSMNSWIGSFAKDPKLLLEVLKSLTKETEAADLLAGKLEVVLPFFNPSSDFVELMLWLLILINSGKASSHMATNLEKWMAVLKKDSGSQKLLETILTFLGSKPDSAKILILKSNSWMQAFQEKPNSITALFKVFFEHIGEQEKQSLISDFNLWSPHVPKDLVESFLSNSVKQPALAQFLATHAEKWLSFFKEDPNKNLSILSWMMNHQQSAQTIMATKISVLQGELPSASLVEFFGTASRFFWGAEALIRSSEWLTLPPKKLQDILLKMASKNPTGVRILAENLNWIEKASSFEALREIIGELKKTERYFSIHVQSTNIGIEEDFRQIFKRVETTSNLVSFCLLSQEIEISEALLNNSEVQKVLKELIAKDDAAIFAKLVVLASLEKPEISEQIRALGFFDRKFPASKLAEACLCTNAPSRLLDTLLRMEETFHITRSEVEAVLKNPEVWYACAADLSQNSHSDEIRKILKSVFTEALKNGESLYFFTAGMERLPRNDLADLLKCMGSPTFSPENYAEVSGLNVEILKRASFQGLPVVQVPNLAKGFKKVADFVSKQNQIDPQFASLNGGIHSVAEYLDNPVAKNGNFLPHQIPVLKQLLSHVLITVDNLQKVIEEKSSSDLMLTISDCDKSIENCTVEGEDSSLFMTQKEEALASLKELNEALTNLGGLITLLNETINNCHIGKDAGATALKSYLLSMMGLNQKSFSSILMEFLAGYKEDFAAVHTTSYEDQSVHTLARIKTVLHPFIGYDCEPENWAQLIRDGMSCDAKGKKSVLINLYCSFTLDNILKAIRKRIVAPDSSEAFEISLKSYLHQRLSLESPLLDESKDKDAIIRQLQELETNGKTLFNPEDFSMCKKVSEESKVRAFRLFCSTSLQKILKAQVKGLQENAFSEVERQAAQELKGLKKDYFSWEQLKEKLSSETFANLENYYLEKFPSSQLSKGVVPAFTLYVNAMTSALLHSLSFAEAFECIEEGADLGDKGPDVLRLFEMVGAPLTRQV